MISNLLANTGAGGATTWILLGCLALLVVVWVVSFVRRKKYNQETIQMLDSLKPGDKIKTYSGVYGTVVSIRETTDGKVITMETGDEKHKSYTSIDANAVYCLDKKEDIVYDKDGNIIEPKEPAKQFVENEFDVDIQQTDKEEIADENVAETTEETHEHLGHYQIVNEEEKPTKKRTKKTK